MAELEAIVLFGVLPVAGALAAWLAIWRQLHVAKRQHSAEALRALRGKVVVLGVLPSTLLLFAFAVAFLYLLGPRPVGGAFLTYGGMAYGIPALLTGLGQAIVYHRGLPSMVRNERIFGRLVVGSVFPEVVVEFGFAVSFLILGLSRGPSPEDLVNAGRAALLVSVGALAAPASAIAFVRTWDWESLPGFRRAVAFSAAVLVVPAVFFALALLALRGAL